MTLHLHCNALPGIKLLHNQSNSNHPTIHSKSPELQSKEKILRPEEDDILSQTQARSP